LNHHKFRKIFIEEDQLPPLVHKLKPAMDSLRDHWEKKTMAPYEVAGFYLLIFLQELVPNGKWALGPRKDVLNIRHDSGYFLLEDFPFLTIPHNTKRILGERKVPLTLVHLLANQSLRGIPQSVHETLLQWSQGHWDLFLTQEIPWPKELLWRQCHGQRVITLVLNGALQSKFILGERDCLSFLLHDLIHAEKFFGHDRLFYPQVGLYRKLWPLLETPWLNEMLKNKKFKDDFEYLMSDMNAYCVHQLKYLKAKFFDYFSQEKYFDPQGETLLIWKQMVSLWDLPEDVQASFLKINQGDFEMEKDSLLIENYLTTFSKECFL
jgi:hypothetical protein